MPFATALSVTLDGATGHVVAVRADVSQGLVATTVVGRPDPSVSEARDRCRTAVVNSNLQWPTTRRVTIALSPADSPLAPSAAWTASSLRLGLCRTIAGERGRVGSPPAVVPE